MAFTKRLVPLLIVVVAVAACGAEESGSFNSPVGGSTGSSAASLPAATSAETPSGSSAATPEPTATVATFRAISLKGSGDKIARFTIPDGAPAIATLTSKGKANFIVTSLAADGTENDLLVNTIGAYDGTVLFDAASGEHSVAFKIEDSGAWTATIKPITAARVWNGKSKLTGKGDDVVHIDPASSGLTIVDVTHSGQANFIVTGYSSSGADLMVNEIGKYSGQVQLADGSFFLTVQADGSWTITTE